jgi:hypothetical protein
MSRNIETNIQASKYPSYVDQNRSVISLIRDITVLFSRLCNYAISYGADIETNRETATIKVVYWKQGEYTTIDITIYSGTFVSRDSCDFTVEFNRLSGSRSLFLEIYRFFISAGNSEGLFNESVPRCSLSKEGIENTKPTVTRDYLQNIFEMIESDYLDMKISGGNLMLKIFKSADQSDKELILKHPKIEKFLQSMMTLLDEGSPNTVCATIAVTFASEAKLETSSLIQTEIINKQNGIMWKEAQRHVEKMQGKL